MDQEVFNAMLANAISSGLSGGSYVHHFSGEEMDALLTAMAAANPMPSGMDWETFVDSCKSYEEDSEAYAVGTRNGTVVTSGDATYHNNSKYYSEQAYVSASSAETDANAAQSYAVGGTGTRTGEDTDNAQYYSQISYNAMQSAAGSSTLAKSWAVGGTGSRAGEDTNNSKYWALQSHAAASDILIDGVTETEYIFAVLNGRLYLQEV